MKTSMCPYPCTPCTPNITHSLNIRITCSPWSFMESHFWCTLPPTRALHTWMLIIPSSTSLKTHTNAPSTTRYGHTGRCKCNSHAHPSSSSSKPPTCPNPQRASSENSMIRMEKVRPITKPLDPPCPPRSPSKGMGPSSRVSWLAQLPHIASQSATT